MKNKKLKPFFVWTIKRKDTDEVYILNDFFWIKSDAQRALDRSRDGAYRYILKEEFEIIKIKISQDKNVVITIKE